MHSYAPHPTREPDLIPIIVAAAVYRAPVDNTEEVHSLKIASSSADNCTGFRSPIGACHLETVQIGKQGPT